MNNLICRVERLERTGRPAWQTKLRAFARKLGINEEKVLLIAKGHEHQLAQATSADGSITWEGFQLFHRLSRERATAHPNRWLPWLCPARTRHELPPVLVRPSHPRPSGHTKKQWHASRTPHGEPGNLQERGYRADCQCLAAPHGIPAMEWSNTTYRKGKAK